MLSVPQLSLAEIEELVIELLGTWKKQRISYPQIYDYIETVALSRKPRKTRKLLEDNLPEVRRIMLEIPSDELLLVLIGRGLSYFEHLVLTDRPPTHEQLLERDLFEGP